jgi:CrcB protein
VVQIAIAGAWHGDVRAAVAAGFLGGFTTYSSFNQETIAMFSSGAAGAAALNIAITLGGGLAAGLTGAAAARVFQS